MDVLARAPRIVAALLAGSLACVASSASSSEVSPASLEPGQGEASGPQQRWTYEIAIDDSLERMQLGLCIEGPRPRSLEAGREALDFVKAARVRGGPALSRAGRKLEIETLGEHGCVDLSIDLDAAAEASGRDSARRGDTAMVAPDRWLWHPSVVPATLEAQARFVLPEGVHATVPWSPIEADSSEDWRRLDHSTFGWNAWIAFGRYDPLEFEIGGCNFEVAVLDGARRASDAGIEAWLRAAAQTSIELYGRFPRERVGVVVVPSRGWGDSPVPFGMARRGGGGSAVLILSSDARDDELIGEWVAAHELLHLGMPLVADPWMSEGFVTYYTQILRARQGVLARDGSEGPANPDEQARRALAALERGFRRARGGVVTLAYASDNMRESGGYGRVYWGGAAVAFDLDRSLRQASDNRRSLDDLMIALVPFAPVHHRWSAEEVVARMDEEVAKWIDAGELTREISIAEIVDAHLRAKTLALDVERLDGLAVDIDRNGLRLRSTPTSEVRVRDAMFERR